MVTFEKEDYGDYTVWDFCVYRNEKIIIGCLVHDKEHDGFTYQQSMANNVLWNDLEEIKDKLIELNHELQEKQPMTSQEYHEEEHKAGVL